jgi:hypothetical protein
MSTMLSVLHLAQHVAFASSGCPKFGWDLPQRHFFPAFFAFFGEALAVALALALGAVEVDFDTVMLYVCERVRV